MTNYELIKKAIQKKKQVHATFKGHRRELCPHVLGKKDKTVNCLFYQFGGSSERGLSEDPNQNWRCIPVEDLQDLTLKDGEWYSWSNYDPLQSCIDKIEVSI